MSMEEERGRQARIAETAAGAVGEAPAPGQVHLDPEIEALLAGAGDDPELRQAILESLREQGQPQDNPAPVVSTSNQVSEKFECSFSDYSLVLNVQET
jgi:hypothetical protein